jgi:arylsulfatase A-like enzyme
MRGFLAAWERTLRYLVLSGVLLGLQSLSSAAPVAESHPNVLVILADDQGWGDLSLNGNRNLATPNIDSIAHRGAAIESFYVCQVCAPTRAEFLTGRYYPRTGVSGVSTGQERLNADEVTLADLFRSSGYATGIFGKWHNGTQSPYHPNDRGFDEFYGFTSGHWGHYFSPPMDHNGTIVRGDGFLADDVTNHAIDFMRSNQHHPFFCYVPLNTPHSPMMVPDEFYEKFERAPIEMRHRDPEREDLSMTRAALAMVENIDWNVGRMLEVLVELDLDDDTIVIFFSDNGPNSYRWNGGMKGRKGSIDEGGVRSPCFVRWPGKIAEGTWVKQISGAVDLLPTLVDLTGMKPVLERPIDGVSIAPWLIGQKVDPDERTLFSVRKNQVSVRRGSFRLDDGGHLFNLQKDPGQRTDVASLHPQLTTELTVLAAKHRETMAREFEKYSDRPFTVGYRDLTILPARDGVPYGSISRSSKAPNNSFFEDWMDISGGVTWEIEVNRGGTFEAVLFYTCRPQDVGVTLSLESLLPKHGNDALLAAKVTEVFDPPLYDKSKERVEKSHYYVKDFKPLHMGQMYLPAGRATIKLGAKEIVGQEAVDVHSLQLIRRSE